MPKDVKQMFLFEGTRKQWLRQEPKYRPRRNIGCNRARGGIAEARVSPAVLGAAGEIRTVNTTRYTALAPERLRRSGLRRDIINSANSI